MDRNEYKEEVLRNFELLKEELKTKTEEQNMGPPELIYIEHDDYKPSDEDYDKAKQEYGFEKPGDTRHILRRWINNECVVERNEKATL